MDAADQLYAAALAWWRRSPRLRCLSLRVPVGLRRLCSPPPLRPLPVLCFRSPLPALYALPRGTAPSSPQPRHPRPTVPLSNTHIPPGYMRQRDETGFQAGLACRRLRSSRRHAWPTCRQSGGLCRRWAHDACFSRNWCASPPPPWGAPAICSRTDHKARQRWDGESQARVRSAEILSTTPQHSCIIICEGVAAARTPSPLHILTGRQGKRALQPGQCPAWATLSRESLAGPPCQPAQAACLLLRFDIVLLLFLKARQAPQFHSGARGNRALPHATPRRRSPPPIQFW